MPLNPPPVIANVWKVEFKWSTHLGVRPHNRLHFEVIGGTASGIAANLQAHLTSSMFDVMNGGHVLELVGITPLDGVTAEQDFPIAGIAGTSVSQMIPSAAEIISLKTFKRGSRGRGRFYCGPVCEGNQADGVIDPVTTAAVQAAWDAFHASMDAAGTRLCIASYKHLDFNLVQTTTVEQTMGTQRRRQSQLR